MKSAYREALLENGRSILEADDVCTAHAEHLEEEGRFDVASAYRHAASMLRRIQAGQDPVDLNETLRASLTIFTGLSR